MEISDNRYEVIDGVQRLSTLVNYIGGKPWNGGEKGGAAKLSKKVATEIRGKAFNDLPSEFKRKIKRSTVPLIEFSQSKPGNHDSKYLIFERLSLVYMRRVIISSIFLKFLVRMLYGRIDM